MNAFIGTFEVFAAIVVLYIGYIVSIIAFAFLGFLFVDLRNLRRQRLWRRGKWPTCGYGKDSYTINVKEGCQRYEGHLGNHAGPWKTDSRGGYRIRYNDCSGGHISFRENPSALNDEPYYTPPEHG